ncbi:MAG: hypothetical protein RR575_00025 [Acinetobacter sp.]
MSYIKIMCKPRNAVERKLLINAGIITASQKHPWVFLEQLFSREWVDGSIKVSAYWNVSTHDSYRVRSLRLTAKQFVDLFNFITLVPEADISHIVPFVESTSRNRGVLKYDYRAGDLINAKYQ